MGHVVRLPLEASKVKARHVQLNRCLIIQQKVRIDLQVLGCHEDHPLILLAQRLLLVQSLMPAHSQNDLVYVLRHHYLRYSLYQLLLEKIEDA